MSESAEEAAGAGEGKRGWGAERGTSGCCTGDSCHGGGC